MGRAIQNAAYLFRLAAAEMEPLYLTHMHVQKLLYYVQGWSLALRNREAFDEEIVAWKHGPVVYKLYGQFKSYGDTPITNFDDSIADSLDDNDRFWLASVWEAYKGYSAIRLRSMTHQESPWRNARIGIPSDRNTVSGNVEITRDAMNNHFCDQIAIKNRAIPVRTEVDWNEKLPGGERPDSKFLEAVQATFIAHHDLLKRLAS